MRPRRSKRSASPTAPRILPNELSGGQQQRVALARAIVTRPSLVLADEPTGALDTVTSQEIMTMFSRLNASGRTIVVITHEEEIAAYAKRHVRLRDGLIIEDHRLVPVEATPPKLWPEPAAGVRWGCLMSGIDALRVAWQGATANKLRSALTMLGVMIGVGAVIILLAVGNGSAQAVQNRIKQLGHEHDHRAQPRPVWSRAGDHRVRSRGTRRSRSRPCRRSRIRRQAPDVESVSPVISTSVTAILRSRQLVLDAGDRHHPDLPDRGGLHRLGRAIAHER